MEQPSLNPSAQRLPPTPGSASSPEDWGTYWQAVGTSMQNGILNAQNQGLLEKDQAADQQQSEVQQELSRLRGK